MIRAIHTADIWPFTSAIQYHPQHSGAISGMLRDHLGRATGDVRQNLSTRIFEADRPRTLRQMVAGAPAGGGGGGGGGDDSSSISSMTSVPGDEDLRDEDLGKLLGAMDEVTPVGSGVEEKKKKAKSSLTLSAKDIEPNSRALYRSTSVADLRKIASKMGVRGRSTMRKGQLINAMHSAFTSKGTSFARWSRMKVSNPSLSSPTR